MSTTRKTAAQRRGEKMMARSALLFALNAVLDLNHGLQDALYGESWRIHRLFQTVAAPDDLHNFFAVQREMHAANGKRAELVDMIVSYGTACERFRAAFSVATAMFGASEAEKLVVKFRGEKELPRVLSVVSFATEDVAVTSLESARRHAVAYYGERRVAHLIRQWRGRIALKRLRDNAESGAES